ncbi:hypothetical protein SDJN03_04341, partial [Cucurbita argyrosperma subsp. sororia]
MKEEADAAGLHFSAQLFPHSLLIYFFFTVLGSSGAHAPSRLIVICDLVDYPPMAMLLPPHQSSFRNSRDVLQSHHDLALGPTIHVFRTHSTSLDQPLV